MIRQLLDNLAANGFHIDEVQPPGYSFAERRAQLHQLAIENLGPQGPAPIVD